MRGGFQCTPHLLPLTVMRFHCDLSSGKQRFSMQPPALSLACASNIPCPSHCNQPASMREAMCVDYWDNRVWLTCSGPKRSPSTSPAMPTVEELETDVLEPQVAESLASPADKETKLGLYWDWGQSVLSSRQRIKRSLASGRIMGLCYTIMYSEQHCEDQRGLYWIVTMAWPALSLSTDMYEQ